MSHHPSSPSHHRKQQQHRRPRQHSPPLEQQLPKMHHGHHRAAHGATSHHDSVSPETITIQLNSILPEGILLTPTMIQKLKHFASHESNANQELLFNATISREWNGKEDVQRILLGISNENGTVPVKILSRASVHDMEFDSEDERDPFVEMTFKNCHASKMVEYGRFLPIQLQACTEDPAQSDGTTEAAAQQQQLHISGELILPSVHHRLLPLGYYADQSRHPASLCCSTKPSQLKIAHNPLTNFLMSNQRAQQVACGYLNCVTSTTRSRQQNSQRSNASSSLTVHFYKDDDSSVSQTSMDGIWISGLRAPMRKHKEYLWAAITRYRHSRLSRRQRSEFLVALLPHGSPSQVQYYWCQSFLPHGEDSEDGDNFSIFPCSASAVVGSDDLTTSLLMKFEHMECTDDEQSADVAIGLTPRDHFQSGDNTATEYPAPTQRNSGAPSHSPPRQVTNPKKIERSAVESPGSSANTSPNSPAVSDGSCQTVFSSPQNSALLEAQQQKMDEMLHGQKEHSAMLQKMVQHISQLQSELTHVRKQLSDQRKENAQTNAQLMHLAELFEQFQHEGREFFSTHQQQPATVSTRSTGVETEPMDSLEASHKTPIKPRQAASQQQQQNHPRNHSSLGSEEVQSQHHQQQIANPYMSMPQYNMAQQQQQQQHMNGYPHQFYHYTPNGAGGAMYPSPADSFEMQRGFYTPQQMQQFGMPQNSPIMYSQNHPSMHQMSAHHQTPPPLNGGQSSMNGGTPSPHQQLHYNPHGNSSPSSAQESTHSSSDRQRDAHVTSPRQQKMRASSNTSHQQERTHVHHDETHDPSPRKSSSNQSSFHFSDTVEPLQSPHKPRYSVIKSPSQQKKKRQSSEKENVHPNANSPSRKNPLLTPRNQKSRKLHEELADEDREYDASIQIPSLIASQNHVEKSGAEGNSTLSASSSPSSAKKNMSKTEKYMSRPPLSAKKPNRQNQLSPATPAVKKTKRGGKSPYSSQLASSSSSVQSPFMNGDDTMPRIDFNPDDDDDDSTTLGDYTSTPMSSSAGNYTMDLDESSNWLTPGAKNYLNRHKLQLNSFSPVTPSMSSR